MALLITTDGKKSEVTPANGSRFELEELQKYVGGMVEWIHFDNGKTMVIHEAGLLLSLPVNKIATEIFDSLSTHTQRDSAGIPGDVLFGQRDALWY